LKHLGRAEFDLAINMSGFKLPEGVAAKLEEWEVPDPVFLRYEEHCDVRDHLERRVMELILKLRKEEQAPHFRGGGSGHVPV
jgi:hypothetical protein